jgi:hypothetical protein
MIVQKHLCISVCVHACSCVGTNMLREIRYLKLICENKKEHTHTQVWSMEAYSSTLGNSMIIQMLKTVEVNGKKPPYRRYVIISIQKLHKNWGARDMYVCMYVFVYACMHVCMYV